MSGGLFRKYLSILCKTIFGVFPPVICWRVVVLCVFNKKRTLCSWGELGLTWNNYLHESFPWIFSNLSFWGESINRNSIIMISRGYHYVIYFVIVSNFYISIDPVYPGSLQRTYHSGWTQENQGSPFTIDPQAHYRRWVLTRYNWSSTNKSSVFYFHHPWPFYP